MQVSLSKCGDIKATSVNYINYETTQDFKNEIRDQLAKDTIAFESDRYYVLYNGKILSDSQPLSDSVRDGETANFTLVPRVLGGKGGFGSMLRAIGAQIEKTTNRDACRDLSGRRLRDINEEQRLKKWFAKQAERENERKEAKKRKLEKLKQVADGPALPKIDDQEFLQKREDIEESVYEAVDAGFVNETSQSSDSNSNSSEAFKSKQNAIEKQSSDEDKPTSSGETSSSCIKSGPGPSSNTEKPIKKKSLMFDEDLESGSDSDSEDDTIPSKVAKIH